MWLVSLVGWLDWLVWSIDLCLVCVCVCGRGEGWESAGRLVVWLDWFGLLWLAGWWGWGSAAGWLSGQSGWLVV